TQREIVRLRGLVGTIDIMGAEIGAAITIDGQSRGDYPMVATLRVSAGGHVVRVYKEGFEPFEGRVDVAGSETARVAARLRALASTRSRCSTRGSLPRRSGCRLNAGSAGS